MIDCGDTREATRKESWYEGRFAFRDGRGLEDCPHPPGSTAGRDWRNGWRSGHDRH